MADWSALERELEAWSRLGETATLWWRDDDAVAATPALQRLLGLTRHSSGRFLPLALAVIPAGADDSLVRQLRGADQIAVLQHGYRHANNAAGTAKKAEFPAGRDGAVAVQELRLGWERLSGLFGDRALPVLVPPWNRIDGNLVERLPEIGIIGLSTYGRGGAFACSRNLRVVNTHVDIVNWRDDRRFLGIGACLDLLIRHLGDRREGRTDRSEATGLLTHHLVHDDGAWDFIESLVRHTARHAAVQWLNVRQLFDRGGRG